MRIVVFGPEQRVGAWEGEEIVDLNRADSQIPANLQAFVEMGEAALARAKAAIPRATVKAAAKDVVLHAPWPGRRIACAGGNFGDHLVGMDINMRGEKDSTVEKTVARTRAGGNWGFWKVPVVVAGPEDDVPYPARTKYLDYEGEAAIVIGKRGKNIKAADIKDYVWGVTLMNDWSIRDGRSGPPRAMSFNMGKNFDMSASLGPSIVVGELDPQNVDVELRVNGDLRQRYNTKDMIFSFGEVLEFLSQDFTFYPGDVISGGTAAGTAADSTKTAPDGSRPTERFLKKGDVVEITSPKIGLLRNRIV
ncbi:MAG TPA: fumarylacetoacetate hydrolase family protein [Candidatus Acidoferrales bacterium]|nr:fumarylacetoacetate hydrolase family protein [Candidatus Acidoferrales bacterium]